MMKIVIYSVCLFLKTSSYCHRLVNLTSMRATYQLKSDPFPANFNKEGVARVLNGRGLFLTTKKIVMYVDFMAYK